MTVFAFFCIITFLRLGSSDLRNCLSWESSHWGDPRNCLAALTVLLELQELYFLKYWGKHTLKELMYVLKKQNKTKKPNEEQLVIFMQKLNNP